LLGVSLSSLEQVLGGTYIFAHGESSGFFLSFDGLFRLFATFFCHSPPPPKTFFSKKRPTLPGMTEYVIPPVLLLESISLPALKNNQPLYDKTVLSPSTTRKHSL